MCGFRLTTLLKHAVHDTRLQITNKIAQVVQKTLANHGTTFSPTSLKKLLQEVGRVAAGALTHTHTHARAHTAVRVCAADVATCGCGCRCGCDCLSV